MMLFFALELKIDASSDTLILEKDKDLRYFQVLNKRYNSPDFLIIAYQPKEKLLSKSVKINIKDISNKLEKLEKVNSVISILNVPLLESSNKKLADLLTSIPTIEDEVVDDESKIKELTTSYIYKNNLVSEDFKTTAILINLNQNKKLADLREKKQKYLELIANKKLDKSELADYKSILLSLSKERDLERNKQKQLVSQAREIINNYKGTGDIYLGGIPMIANDVVAFVKNDLKVFGVSILLFLIITLTVIFRQSRWVIMPVITCFFSVIITAGIFSIFNWEVTVISSNFISLQLILTMAITIHLIVRYRELALKNIFTDQKSLLFETIKQMIKPCFFTVITTIAGFSSLILSGLLPVINFGWMMSVGVIISLTLTFIMFPALMKEFKILLPNTKFESFFNLPQLVAQVTLK
jgi:predicted RND superfamily exporter protein